MRATTVYQSYPVIFRSDNPERRREGMTSPSLDWITAIGYRPVVGFEEGLRWTVATV